MTSKRLIIIGAGGLGRETLWVAQRCDKWKIEGFVDDDDDDDDDDCDKQHMENYHVLGNTYWLTHLTPYLSQNLFVVCGIGNPIIRKKMAIFISLYNVAFATLIDPSCIINKSVEIGIGTVVTAKNIITVDVIIGNHAFINLNCTIGHNAVIENYVNCAPGCNISGNVKLKEGVRLGTNVSIIPGITIGAWSTIGAGSTVINDIPDHCIAVGSPAKVIK